MINQSSVSNTNQSLGTEKPKKQHKTRKIILTCIAIFLGICFLCAIFDDEDGQSISVEKMEITKSDDKNTKSITEQGDSQKSKPKTERTDQEVGKSGMIRSCDPGEKTGKIRTCLRCLCFCGVCHIMVLK